MLLFTVIKQKILTKVGDKFESAQLHPEDPHYEVGKRIINDLLKSKELSFIAFKKYFNKKHDELNKVLAGNVFAYHPEKKTVTFQSQSVEYYIRENADMFIEKDQKIS